MRLLDVLLVLVLAVMLALLVHEITARKALHERVLDYFDWDTNVAREIIQRRSSGD